jgi:hypothetical protein
MLAVFDTLASTLYAAGGEVLPEQQGCNCTAAAACGSPAGAEVAPPDFERSRVLFDAQVAWLGGEQAGVLAHGELEERLQVSARELHRQLLQDHLDLRAIREQRLDRVVDARGIQRGQFERGHQRPLASVFGQVRVNRNAYRARGCERLYPADAVLNLPEDLHSHGLTRLAAIESARGSFDDAQQAIVRCSGQLIGKRQLERLAQHAAVDFDAFYAQRQSASGEDAGRENVSVLVLSCDGKGVVMRPDALRPETRRQAQRGEHKLASRLSRGEKRGRKRMAEVGAVYEIKPIPRTALDIMPTSHNEPRQVTAGPIAQKKWLTASVVDDAATVVAQLFEEALRRDPEHQRDWIALVDGNNHQIDRITKEAQARDLKVTIVVDLIHVLEYVWKAVWCFFKEGDRAAEQWVAHHVQQILAGHARRVAGAIRRAATNRRLTSAERAGADACADYLTSKSTYLDYPTALAKGWPIATGVIEGACRHLVKDRMDLTGARWGLPGAEAILKLRAIHTNGDFDAYWTYHLSQEHQRVHHSRYAQAAPGPG